MQALVSDLRSTVDKIKQGTVYMYTLVLLDFYVSVRTIDSSYLCPSQKYPLGHNFAVNDQIELKLGLVVHHTKKVCCVQEL